MFIEGVNLYETSDYQGAIDKFTQAYGFSRQIEGEERRGKALHALQFNLARAHLKMHEIDEDAQHIRTAIDLLGKYLDRGDEYGVDRDAELLLQQAEAALEAVNEGGASATPEPASAEEQTPQDPSEQGSGADRADTPSAKKLRVGGYVFVGLAAASLGVMGGGMAMAKKADGDFDTAGTSGPFEDAQRRGKLGNALTISGAVMAGVFAVAGVTVLVVAAKARGRAGRTARVNIAPMTGRAGTGLMLGGRF